MILPPPIFISHPLSLRSQSSSFSLCQYILYILKNMNYLRTHETRLKFILKIFCESAKLT